MLHPFSPYADKITAMLVAFAPKLLQALIIFVACWFIGLGFNLLTKRFGRSNNTGRRDVFILLGKSAHIFFIVIGLISALGTLGMNVSALVASLGLTGFALGFALKDIVSNLLAGILLIAYRPFKRGDFISVTGLDGMVESIDIRYTVLRTESRRIIIPNANLFTNPVIINHEEARAFAGK
jgi:small conductance mechanosensitive channel